MFTKPLIHPLEWDFKIFSWKTTTVDRLNQLLNPYHLRVTWGNSMQPTRAHCQFWQYCGWLHFLHTYPTDHYLRQDSHCCMVTSFCMYVDNRLINYYVQVPSLLFSLLLKPSPNEDTLVSHCSMTCVYLLSLFLQPAIYILSYRMM